MSDYNRSSLSPTASSIELNHSRDSFLMTDDMSTGNRRLAQAIRYLLGKGEHDSRELFIKRVYLIDRYLLKQLPRQGTPFNIKLYRQVQTIVRNYQKEFKQAANTDTIPFEDDTVPYQREHQNPSTDKDISNLDIGSPAPAPILARKRSSNTSLLVLRNRDNERIRGNGRFAYGGSNEEPEVRHMISPKSLSSLSSSDDTQSEGSEGMQQYKSGSHSELPLVAAEKDQQIVNSNGTVGRLLRSAKEFNHKIVCERAHKGNASPVLLGKLRVGYQEVPRILTENDIRKSINLSPTKPSTARSQTTVSERSQSRVHDTHSLYDASDRFAASKVAPAAHPQKLSISVPASESCQRASPGPAIRAINKAIYASLGEGKSASPTRSTKQNNTTSDCLERATKGATTQKVATNAKARLRKSPQHVRSEVLAMSSRVNRPESDRRMASGSKRKHSEGSAAYTPESSALKKTLRLSKKARIAPETKVTWSDEPVALDDDETDPSFVQSPVEATRTRAKTQAAAVNPKNLSVSSEVNQSEKSMTRRTTRGLKKHQPKA